jgi:hypothetical protein
MPWIKANLHLIQLGVGAFLLIAAVIGHQIAAHKATSRAFDSGYAKAAAENNAALSARIAQDAALIARDKTNTEQIIHDYEIVVAAHRANLDDALRELANVRVRLYAASSGGSGPVSSIRSTPGSTNDPADDAGRDVPSLDILGAELSQCEIEGDRLAALQAWVRAREKVQHQ